MILLCAHWIYSKLASMVALEASKLFSELPPSELPAIEKVARIRKIPAGSVIFQEGDPGDGVYVVREGSVKITAVIHQEERRVLSRIAPGEFFGEMAVLDREPRSATAMAETDCEVYFIARDDLLQVAGGRRHGLAERRRLLVQDGGQVDMRVSRLFRLPGATRVRGSLDIYNIFNTNAEQEIATGSGASYLRPVAITAPRIARVGIKLDW